MTLKELKSRVKVKPLHFEEDQFVVTIIYRGKSYSCFSKNNYAFKRICLAILDKEIGDKTEQLFYTLKNAYLTFYNECKVKNGFKI